MSPTDGDPQLAEISKKLDILIRLSALNLVREMKTQREQVGVLSDAGFQPKEIGEILLVPRTTVNAVLYQIRKGRALKEGEEKPAPAEDALVQKEGEKGAEPSVVRTEREAK